MVSVVPRQRLWADGGHFQRIFQLPNDTKEDGVKADFSDGILKIKVPKRRDEEPKAKKIQVTAF